MKVQKNVGDLSVFSGKCSYFKRPHEDIVDHHILMFILVASGSSQIQSMLMFLGALLQRAQWKNGLRGHHLLPKRDETGFWHFALILNF